jgi:carbamoyl-phosphate synthase small subunit
MSIARLVLPWLGRAASGRVDTESIPDRTVRMTHVNLNDNTCEGLRHKELPVFSVQYHPEAAPGPHDALYLFKRFVELLDGVTV